MVVQPTNKIQNSAPDWKDLEYETKMEPFPHDVFFGGDSLINIRLADPCIGPDAVQVSTTCTIMELVFNTVELDKDLFWPKFVAICGAKQRKTSPALCKWFDENLNPNFSWMKAKHIILHNLGIYSRKVRIAIKFQIGLGQLSQESVEDYCIRFGSAAEAAVRMIKEEVADPIFSTESKLIDSFIEGLDNNDTGKLAIFLDALRAPTARNGETWKDFVRKMDKNKRKVRYVELMDKCNLGQADEAEKYEYRQIYKRIKEEEKEEAIKQAERTQQLQVKSAILMDRRKKMGFCSFCGVVKHSFKHSRACKAKKKYFANDRVLPKEYS